MSEKAHYTATRLRAVWMIATNFVSLLELCKVNLIKVPFLATYHSALILFFFYRSPESLIWWPCSISTWMTVLDFGIPTANCGSEWSAKDGPIPTSRARRITEIGLSHNNPWLSWGDLHSFHEFMIASSCQLQVQSVSIKLAKQHSTPDQVRGTGSTPLMPAAVFKRIW